MMELSQIVDLERYPIAELGQPGGRALIAACRGQMAETGLCLLPDGGRRRRAIRVT